MSDFSEHVEKNKKVHVFYISYDMLDDGSIGQRKEQFYQDLFLDIPAFAFGPKILSRKYDNLSQRDYHKVFFEAVRKIYEIPEMKEASDEYLNFTKITQEKYIKKGEFGELLLYHLLYHYFGADALISKIYFKDSNNVAAHGFDAVHVDVKNQTLWLGESKLYQSGKVAINELAKDVMNHFNMDFLNSEFQIITNRIHDSYEQDAPEFILQLLDEKTKKLDQLANINIALFAAYNSDAIKNYDEQQFKSVLASEIELLEQRAQNKIGSHPWNSQLQIFLFLFPLEDKNDFVASLHRKLKAAQSI